MVPPILRTRLSVLESRDPPALQRRVVQLEHALHIETLARERAEYKVQDLLRRLYGPKSDKVDPAQLTLLGDQMRDDQALAEVKPPVPQVAANPEKRRKGGGGRPAPRNLMLTR